MSGSIQSMAGQRFSVGYLLHGTSAEARRTAELLCLDQTVEASPQFVAHTHVAAALLGQIEGFTTTQTDRHELIVSYPVELFGTSCSQLLHTLFGTVSLKPHIRLTRFELPDPLPRGWTGPRFGRTGVRSLVDVPQRPLVCAVLKPLGLPPQALAELAYQFARAGADFVKDDQGLGDQPFCPFDERVKRCAEAVAKANAETGKQCLYVPHISGPWEVLHRNCSAAARAGAGGLLICPGLTGFDAVRELSRDDAVALPILSHPAILGSYSLSSSSGIAPPALFGQLPRLIGADVTIFPSYGLEFPISRDDCKEVAHSCEQPWGGLKPIFPTAAGRMGIERVREMIDVLGRDLVFILGSQVQLHPEGCLQGCRQFIREVERCAY